MSLGACDVVMQMKSGAMLKIPGAQGQCYLHIPIIIPATALTTSHLCTPGLGDTQVKREKAPP